MGELTGQDLSLVLLIYLVHQDSNKLVDILPHGIEGSIEHVDPVSSDDAHLRSPALEQDLYVTPR